ncbi:Uncharacterised protein [Candidatus Gugararchaeum adminiculabundum]|nr:Uncharacterised protein [Candidatus Gugararchaeum adminiculabundum]
MFQTKNPIEILHWYILPAVTAELSTELVGKGMRQNEIARLFGLTPAAITQYKQKKRGAGFTLTERDKKAISALASRIVREHLTEEQVISALNSLVEGIRSSGEMCHVCHEFAQAPAKCSICVTVPCAVGKVRGKIL